MDGPQSSSLSSASFYSNPKSWKIESYLKIEHLTVVSISKIINATSVVLISMLHLNIWWHAAIFVLEQVTGTWSQRNKFSWLHLYMKALKKRQWPLLFLPQPVPSHIYHLLCCVNSAVKQRELLLCLCGTVNSTMRGAWEGWLRSSWHSCSLPQWVSSQLLEDGNLWIPSHWDTSF